MAEENKQNVWTYTIGQWPQLPFSIVSSWNKLVAAHASYRCDAVEYVQQTLFAWYLYITA